MENNILDVKREEIHRQMRKEQNNIIFNQMREQLLKVQYPIKSSTLGLFINIRANQLENYANQIGDLLRNQNLQELSDQDHRDLIQDLLYLLIEKKMQIKDIKLTLKKNDDPKSIQLASFKFQNLHPAELDYWIQLMNQEERSFVYAEITPTSNCQYLTKKIINYIIDDLGLETSISLIAHFFHEKKMMKQFINVNFLQKLQQNLIRSNENTCLFCKYLYIIVSLHVTAENFREGFSKYLFALVCNVCSVIQQTHKFQEFIYMINRNIYNSYQFALLPEFQNIVLLIEKKLCSRNNKPDQVQYCAKTVLRTIQSFRRRKIIYTPPVKILQALRYYLSNDPRQHVAYSINKVLSLFS